MKTKTKRRANGIATDRNGVVAKRVIVKGKRMVMLGETEFDLLLQRADLWEPVMPEPDADGLYPAIETGFISLAIDIIRDRRRLGLTQADLARLTGIRLATLQRVESGERRPTSVRTIEKIDKALQAAEAELGTHASNGGKPRKKKAKATA
jgi:DNA-binding XRE family transcriptional regulator